MISFEGALEVGDFHRQMCNFCLQTGAGIAATAGIIIAVTAVRNGGSGKGVQTKLHPHIPSDTLVTGMCIKAKVDTITM